MKLKYKCKYCVRASIFMFYNPCAFLLHARQHFNLLTGDIDLGHLEICDLPLGMGGFLPHPSIPLLYDVADDNGMDPAFVNSHFYSPVFADKGREIVRFHSSDLLFLSATNDNPPVILALRQISWNIPRSEFVAIDSRQIILCNNSAINNNLTAAEVKHEPTETDDVSLTTGTERSADTSFENYPVCPECHMQQKIPMINHILGNNKPYDEALKCPVCKFVAPTNCCLTAHIRIHDGEFPYVCPECGKDFEKFNLLLGHLDDVCFHLGKQVRFRCPAKKCGKLFAQTATFSTHFVTHFKILQKCEVCKIEASSYEEFKSHCVVKHSSDSLIPQKIYKCMACVEKENRFSEENYKDHIEEHTTGRNNCMYAYMCKWCKSYFRSTLTYATHLLRCAKYIQFNQTSSTPHITEEQNIAAKIHYVMNICLKCNTKIRYPISQSKPSSCPTCRESFSDPLGGATEQNDVIPTRDFRCILCKNQITQNEKSAHISKCKFGKPFVILHRIGSNEHKPKNVVYDSGSPTSDDSSKRKRKRYPNPSANKSKKLYASNVETAFDLEADEPIDFDGTYRCQLCGYQNVDRTDFHKHIKSHRDISTSYQCMECGECFVVKPSLVKHLQYFHKLINVDEYFTNNDCFDKVAVKELEKIIKLPPGESKKVAENQCSVCMQQFCDNFELRKHLRVHGMAFLMYNSK